MRSISVALLVLVAAGCGCQNCGDKDAKGSNVEARLDDRHTLTAPVTVGNLTVWPVLTDKPLDLGEFLTLDEALAKGSAEVREVGGAQPAQQAAPAGQVDAGAPRQPEAVQLEEPPTVPPGEAAREAQTAQTLTEILESLEQAGVPGTTGASGATVGTLVIENKGDVPILVCAGTVVKGGNQDRQIGQDVVLKAKTTTPVDAFCVEQGRWESARLGQETGGKFEVLDGMATAKVRAKGQYEKDQGGVWQEVAEARTDVVRLSHQDADAPGPSGPPMNPPVLVSAGLHSGPTTNAAIGLSTTSFAAAFDANAASSEDLKRLADAVKKHFAGEPRAVGFAYAVNGKPVAVRTFAHPRLLGKQLDDFVRGMATEALLAKSEATAKQATAADVVNLVASISSADEKVAATKGLNQNGIRVNATGYNANCYVAGADGKLEAVTRDWTAK